MGFFRENGLKFIIILVVIVIITIVFTFMFSGKSKKIKTYGDMENSLKNAAISYTNSNTSLLPKEEGTIKKVNLDTLVNEKKIDQLYAIDDSNIACTGYVTVEKRNDSYIYTPYIKCGKHYETKTIGQYIIDKEGVITTGDGLYNYNGTYVFKGENPNNYVMLGEKLFRIIEITNNNELKLIAVKKIENVSLVWDDRYNSEKDSNDGINNFSKSRLKDSLEEIYNSEYFTDSDREKIIKHDLCVGKRALSDTSIDGKAECSVIESDQYVGLIQTNEYARASLDENCISIDKLECQNYNFLNFNTSLRTQNAVLDNTYQVYYISMGELSETRASSSFYPYPVIYIDQDVLYQSGEGTEEKPYILE